MSTGTIVAMTLVLVIALFAGYIYLFGIPPEMKREMEEKALETMGENKASAVLKDAIGKVPASDQEDVKELKSSLGNLAGGGLQNPLGKMAGDLGDDATKDFTGR